MPRTLIPFSSGTNEAVDPKMLPNGALRSVRNLRLRRGAQLSVRSEFEELGLTHAGGEIVPSDIVEFSGRLMALASADTTDTAPCDLFEYIGKAGADWRASFQNTGAGTGRRLCSVTQLRNLGRMPLQDSRNNVADIAAAGGTVVVLSSEAAATAAQVVDTTTTSADTMLSNNRLASVHCRAVALSGGELVVVGRSGTLAAPGDIVRLFRLAPGETVFTQLVDAPALGSLQCLDACQDGDGFAVAVGAAGSSRVYRFDSAGAVQQNYAVATVASAAAVSIARCGASFVVASKSSGDSGVSVTSVTADGGGGAVGPTAIAGLTTELQPGLVSIRDGAAFALLIGGVGSNGEHFAQIESRNVSDHLAVPGHASSGARWSGVKLTTKPIEIQNSVGDSPLLFGGVILDHFGNGTSVLCESHPTELVAASTDRLVAVTGEESGGTFDVQLSSLALDAVTGKAHWVRSVRDADDFTAAVGCEFELAKLERRQMMAANGELYVAGGASAMYDTRGVFEAGFIAPPDILDETATTGGSLTEGTAEADTVYQVAVVFEETDSQGKSHQSEPSAVCEVALGVGENAIDLVIAGPMSARHNSTNSSANTLKAVVYQSLPAPDVQLKRAEFTFAGTSFGAPLSVTLTKADDEVREQGVIYTQGATGIRSGPNPFDPPHPNAYIWPSADRILSGGLPDAAQIQESREAFPFEPVTWASNLGGLRDIREDVLAVASLDERRVVFTQSSIFMVDGAGLDINGVGDLGKAVQLPSPCGLARGRDGWKSLVAFDQGLMFQGVEGLIYMLPRGGGSPIPIGEPVQDTLERFPVIEAAAYSQSEQTVVFGCNNEAGTASVLLVFDISVRQWSVDSNPGTVLGLTHHNGELVVLRGDRTVHRQTLEAPVGNFIATEIITGTVHPFAHGVEGQIDAIQLVGEYRGDCVLRCFLSRDDGLTEEEMDPKTMVGLEVGESFTRTWRPDTGNGSRFRFRFQCTEDDGPSEGVRYSYAVIHSTSNNTPQITDDEDHG